MDIEHDDVEPPSRLVHLFASEISNEESSDKEKWVDRDETVEQNAGGGGTLEVCQHLEEDWTVEVMKLILLLFPMGINVQEQGWECEK